MLNGHNEKRKNNTAMRNLFILFCLFFLITRNSFCQSLPDSSATWTVASLGWMSYYANNTYSITGDTTINSSIYKSIYVTNDSIFNPLEANYFCAVRELNNKWFFVPANSTKEFMLYDFNVKKGDTVTINNPWVAGEMDLIVFDVDSIEVNGGLYNLEYYLSPSRFFISDHWIKGVGSTQGLHLSGLRMLDAGYQLLCFHRNDTLVYLNSPDGTCGYLTTGINSNSLISDIKLSPNPVSNQLSIISNHDLVVELYNSLGKKVISSDRKFIDVSDLVDGVYIAKIFDSKMKFIKTEKIIKQ